MPKIITTHSPKLIFVTGPGRSGTSLISSYIDSFDNAVCFSEKILYKDIQKGFKHGTRQFPPSESIEKYVENMCQFASENNLDVIAYKEPYAHSGINKIDKMYNLSEKTWCVLRSPRDLVSARKRAGWDKISTQDTVEDLKTYFNFIKRPKCVTIIYDLFIEYQEKYINAITPNICNKISVLKTDNTRGCPNAQKKDIFPPNKESKLTQQDEILIEPVQKVYRTILEEHKALL